MIEKFSSSENYGSVSLLILILWIEPQDTVQKKRSAQTLTNNQTKNEN